MVERKIKKLLVILILLLTTVLLLTGCFGSLQNLTDVSTYDVTFNVKDNSDNFVSGAAVTLDGNTKTTDGNGNTTFKKSKGNYTYTVNAVSYIQVNDVIEVNGADKIVKVTLIKASPITYDVTFTVKDESDNPISGAEITLDSSSQITNIEGVAVFSKPNGTYNYTVSHGDYEEKSNTVAVNDANTTVDVTLNEAMTQVFTEDFTGLNDLPTGWSTYVSSQYTEGPHWTLEQTNHAGGNSPEVSFNQGTQVLTYRLISTIIDITNYSEASLEFKHFSNDFNGTYDYSLLVQISTDGGSTWQNTDWSIVNPYSNVGPETVSISLNDYTGGSIKIGWTFIGFSWAVNYWNIDDIIVKGR